MKILRFVAMVLLIVSLVISSVFAAPVTGACTLVTNKGATFNAAGAGTVGWFEYGSVSGGPYSFATENETPVAGVFSEGVYGSMILTSSTYYVRACDETGCGVEVTFTTSAAVPVNKTYFGTGLITVLKSGMNITKTFEAIATPYENTLGGPITYGLLFFFIFAGMWIRQKDVLIPCIAAMVCGAAIWLPGASLGVPPEFASIGQGLMYASMAGIALSWFKR